MMQIITSVLHLATFFHPLIGSAAVRAMQYGKKGWSGKAKGFAFVRLYNFLPHNRIVCRCTVLFSSVMASVMASFVVLLVDNESGPEDTSFKAQ